jgi:hypothetical protein
VGISTPTTSKHGAPSGCRAWPTAATMAAPTNPSPWTATTGRASPEFTGRCYPRALRAGDCFRPSRAPAGGPGRSASAARGTGRTGERSDAIARL